MTTLHAIERTKKRAKLGRNASIRLIKNAINYGRCADDFDSMEHKYLAEKESLSGDYALAYEKFCFIISKEGTWITMFELPEWFLKRHYFKGKQKINNPRKHMLYYEKPWYEEDLLYYRAS